MLAAALFVPALDAQSSSSRRKLRPEDYRTWAMVDLSVNTRGTLKVGITAAQLDPPRKLDEILKGLFACSTVQADRMTVSCRVNEYVPAGGAERRIDSGPLVST